MNDLDRKWKPWLGGHVEIYKYLNTPSGTEARLTVTIEFERPISPRDEAWATEALRRAVPGDDR